MSLKDWWHRRAQPEEKKADPVDSHFEKAMRVTEEVMIDIRERARSAHPFRLVLTELLIGPNASVDVALIADAYEMSEESRIYQGLNGHGR